MIIVDQRAEVNKSMDQSVSLPSIKKQIIGSDYMPTLRSSSNIGNYKDNKEFAIGATKVKEKQ